MPYTISQACIGCTICAKSCPVWAISGTVRQLHSINSKRCVDCGVCGRVCPSGAVLDNAGQPVLQVDRKNWRKPAIDEGLCSACSLCADICRFQCIGMSPPQYQGDFHVHAALQKPEKCVDCGLCVKICPLHAITMKEVTA